MQLDELLKSLKPKYEVEFIDADRVIKKLRETIESIPDRESIVASDAQKTFEASSNIRIPLPNGGKGVTSKLLLKYSKPAHVSLVGSFVRKTALLLDGKVTIDMAVTMPSHLYQAKDYRDYRYFQKRAYYLACLTDGIQKACIPHLAMSFAYQDDNQAQPILVIEPVQDGQDNQNIQRNYRIRILLAAGIDLFPIDKTLPTKACIRSSAPKMEVERPSPTYNATIRSECCSLLSSRLLHQSVDQSSSFRDACMLGAIWLRQRGIGASIAKGGFGQFEWASVMSALMHSGERANRRDLMTSYSSYQLFKATLQFLANTDLVAFPIFYPSIALDVARTNHPTLFDESRGLNLLFKMSSWSYKRADGARVCLKEHEMFAAGGDSMLNWTADGADKVHARFTYGLGDRTTLICPHVPSRASWRVSSAPPLLGADSHVTVGLLLNPENSRRTVDRGPPVDNNKASALFREFWGDRAELRRFKDGTISESVVWTEPDAKRTPLNVIIRHILERHFDIHESSDGDIIPKAVDNLLPQQESTQTDLLGPFTSTRNTYEALSKSIRDLENLPLQIRQISAASPALRFSSITPPIANKQSSLEWSVEIQIQFEGSTLWPQDLVAVQRTKIAFLQKVADGLERGGWASTVALALGTSKGKLPEEPFLDVATQDGVIFRLRIYHEYELRILEQALRGQAASAASREELALAILEHKRRYIHGPAHTQAVFALSTKFSLLSPTIRLLKKWRDAHLLSSHLRDELIEILAIRTFLHPAPWQPPGSLNSAFFRTLAFIASWDWHLDPLIVDLNSELRKPDIEGISTAFQARRKLDPGMHRVAMFAASDIDRDGIVWTDRRPAKVIASRFTKLAAAATAMIKESGLGLAPDLLFLPSLAEYDFVVHLRHEVSEAKSTKSFKNIEMGTAKNPLKVLLKPAQEFFDELEDLYGDHIVFFHNQSAATAIAGLWNPTTGPRNWKIDLGYNAIPMYEVGSVEPHLMINKLAVLHDIARLGGDMIAKIDHNL
ncbi:MAG: hypothetical protein Q9197_000188 [Variospora fuerteventurae]